MSNFPTSLDTTTTIPQPTSGQNTNSPGHAELHTAESQAIIAIESKIGIGSSTPSNNTVMRGNGAGTSGWDQVHLGTDVSGQLPVANGGTGASTSTGSGAVVLQNSPTLTSPTMTGGATVSGGLTVDNVNGYNPSTGWLSLANTYTYGANNGNKEFTVTVPADLRTTLYPGMRIQFSRGTAPPTQCAAFVAASSEYATKASPSGITFTSAFTCEAWVYLNSYPSSSNFGGIIGRSDDSTGGFQMEVNSSGQLRLYYGASSAFTDQITDAALPLNRWVHVAAVCSSVSSKTFALYINGLSAPTFSTLSSATSLAQTSNLTVGGIGAGVANRFLNGYVSEARIWSAAQTQANIQANMTKNLTGSETNLVALYQFNGTWTDATTNANTLTATNGPVNTQASNPYNAVEYGIITMISYSNPTTTLTIFTGTDYMIPNMSLTSPQFSREKAPYGFPSARGKWIVDCLCKATASQSSPVTSTWYNAGSLQLSIPTGPWRVGYETNLALSGSASQLSARATLSTANNSESDPYTTAEINIASPTTAGASVKRETDIKQTSQSVYYLNAMVASGTSVTTLYLAVDVPTVIRAECAYV